MRMAKPVDKYSHRIVLCHDEDSLRERRGCVRSNQVFDVSEEMRVVSGRDLASMGLPCLRRIHFSGTNFGTKIGDIVMPNFGLAWQLPCSAKHEIHGTWRKAVGGVAQGDDNAGSGVKRKTADTVEPVFWHARPLKFWQEITHIFKLCALVDFACSDGVLAFACAKARIPYLGYALSTPHLEQVRLRLIEQVMSSMCDEKDPIYDPKLASVNQGTTSSQPGAAGVGGKRKGRGKQKQQEPAASEASPPPSAEEMGDLLLSFESLE